MTCPSCGAAVEDGADLCLECGEPMGDSPAANAARQENVIRPPADAFAAPKPGAPVAAPKPGAPAAAPKAGAPASTPRPGAAPPPPPTLPDKPASKRKWATEEPEPARCPGCGVKSHAERCPSCGNKMPRHE
jgi:zinc-ribbon domain